MFPVLLLGLVGAVLGYERRSAPEPQSALSRRAGALAARVRAFRGSRLYASLGVWNALGMLLLAVYPLGWRPHLVFARWVHDQGQRPAQCEVCAHERKDTPNGLTSRGKFARVIRTVSRNS